MASYVVTGAAGFIGSQVALALLNQGHTVLGVDNLSQAYDVRMKQHRLEALTSRENFKLLQADIAEKATIDQLFAQNLNPDAVINLAAIAGVRASTTDPWSYLNTNTFGTLNMLEYARHQKVPKFILASTSSLYGEDGTPPHNELAPTDHPLAPYAASKKGAEAFAYSYHHLYKIDISVLRYFTVYGPAGRPDMSMFRFCQWISEGRPVTITGDGSQSRGFTYVDDIASGTLLALKKVGYEVFNLGGHEVISINDLVSMLEEMIGKPALRQYIPAHPADVYSNVADVSKARQMLGWQPQIGLEEGVRRLVDWYRSNRPWAKDIITD
jgi:nucleoside-diphosphate-sugar epimerase